MNRQVPLSIVLIIFAVAVGIMASLLFFMHEFQYPYALSWPDKERGPKGLPYGPDEILSNADFFQKTSKSLVEQKASFIEADLSSMKLKVYKEGTLEKEVTILSKGKTGLWWQTPAGLYKIESKENSHFSSFGKVYQPWSMAFQGNFFIHGWPAHADGTPVPAGYSGGCIRLSDEDAKAVYDLSTVGMPVLVFEKGFETENFSYQPKVQGLSADSFLAADLKSNTVLLSQNATSSRSIASITKLVTALVAAEYINLDKKITITPGMIATTSKQRLYPGQVVTAYNLLYPLLLESSNEAADALAQSLGTSYFVSLMNKKVKSLGMNDTVLTDPAGRDATNISTDQDLFTLAKYIYLNRNFIFRLTAGTLSNAAYEGDAFQNLGNFNLYAGDKTFIGGKIGKTLASKETMLAVFDLQINGTSRPVAIVVLGSDEVKGDIDQILNYVKRRY